MEDSILTSTKKMLGLQDEYDVYDLDILTCINSAMTNLNQLGIGPDDGFVVEDNVAVWEELDISNNVLGMVKSYVYLRVGMLWDPPTMGFLIDLKSKQLEEMEWRLVALRDAELEVEEV